MLVDSNLLFQLAAPLLGLQICRWVCFVVPEQSFKGNIPHCQASLTFALSQQNLMAKHECAQHAMLLNTACNLFQRFLGSFFYSVMQSQPSDKVQKITGDRQLSELTQLFDTVYEYTYIYVFLQLQTFGSEENELLFHTLASLFVQQQFSIVHTHT